MKTHLLIWHLFLKDIRKQRFALLFLIAMAIYVVLAASSNVEYSEYSSYIAFSGFVFLLVLIFIGSILLDPPGRSIQFLQTRPISSIVVWMSKLLFALLLGVMPMVFCTLLSIALLGIHLTGLDELILIAETSVRTAALLMLFLITGLYFRSLVGIVLGLVGLGISVGLLLYGLTDFLSLQTLTYWSAFDIYSLFLLSGMPWFVLTVILMSWIRYYSKKVVLPILVGVIGIIFSARMANWVHLEGILKDTIILSPASSQPHLQAIFPADINKSLRYSKDPYVHVISPIKLVGPVELFYPFAESSSSAHATLPSGGNLQSFTGSVRIGQDQVTATDFVPGEILGRMVGMDVGNFSRTTDGNADIFVYLDPDLEKRISIVPKIYGSLVISCRQANRFPFYLELKSGSEADLHRVHYVIQNVQRSGDKVSFDLEIIEVPTDLRSTEQIDVQQEILIFNLAEKSFKADTLIESENGGSSLFVRRHIYHIKSDWVPDGQIALFSLRDSFIPVPYELNNVNLCPVSH